MVTNPCRAEKREVMELVNEIQRIINNTGKNIYHLRQKDYGYERGKEPEFPMVVLLLGEDSIRGFSDISKNLLDIWPSYKEDLSFVGITKKGKQFLFHSLKIGENDGLPESISEEELSEKVSKIFDIGSHFRNKDQLLLYHILDTTSFRELSEWEDWMQGLEYVRTILLDNRLNAVEMCMVLLKENMGSRNLALSSQIKNAIYEKYEKEEKELTNIRKREFLSTLLISNRRSDNAILKDWELPYKIVANTIALTNNVDREVARVLFHPKVYTVGYALEKKPVREISQTITEALLQRFAEEEFKVMPQFLSEEQFKEKMALNAYGILPFVDAYVENRLAMLLPKSEELALFPRRSAEAYRPESFEGMSAGMFNQMTMGAWNCFLNGVLTKVKEEILNQSEREVWKREYLTIISKNFSQNEILGMVENIHAVKGILQNIPLPSEDLPVLLAAKEKMKYLLSSNPELINMFTAVLEELANEIKESQKTWRELLHSSQQIHSVQDGNLQRFYTKLVKEYFSHHYTEIADSWNQRARKDSWMQWIEKTLAELTRENPVFSAPFEEELESRLKENQNPIDVKNYISERLKEQSVPLYFPSIFSNGDPLVSCVMIRQGTPLHQSLQEHLRDTYYYSIGNSNSAEALYFYAVSESNLLYKEENKSEV